MNKHGQALVIFIFFIPIFLLFCTLIIDTGLMVERNIKSKSLIKFALKNNYDINSYFEINNIKLESIEKKENCVIIVSRVDSVFGNILGYKNYKVESKYCE